MFLCDLSFSIFLLIKLISPPITSAFTTSYFAFLLNKPVFEKEFWNVSQQNRRRCCRIVGKSSELINLLPESWPLIEARRRYDCVRTHSNTRYFRFLSLVLLRACCPVICVCNAEISDTSGLSGCIPLRRRKFDHSMEKYILSTSIVSGSVIRRRRILFAS